MMQQHIARKIANRLTGRVDTRVTAAARKRRRRAQRNRDLVVSGGALGTKDLYRTFAAETWGVQRSHWIERARRG